VTLAREFLEVRWLQQVLRQLELCRCLLQERLPYGCGRLLLFRAPMQGSHAFQLQACEQLELRNLDRIHSPLQLELGE
jgi:hypothetical protein